MQSFLPRLIMKPTLSCPLDEPQCIRLSPRKSTPAVSSRPLFLQVKKMKTREGRCFAPGHTADVGWSLGQGPHSSPDPQASVLLLKLHFLSTRLWWTHPFPPEHPTAAQKRSLILWAMARPPPCLQKGRVRLCSNSQALCCVPWEKVHLAGESRHCLLLP